MTVRRALPLGLCLVLCGVVGLLSATTLGVTAVSVLVAAACLLGIGGYTRAPMGALAVMPVWAGYVLFSRDFADLHVSVGPLPLYVGELLLLVTLPWAVGRLDSRKLFRNPFFVTLFAWMVFCAFRLLAGGLSYGIDALRDSAIWYYGLFSLVGYVLWRSITPAAWTRFFTGVFIALIVVTAALLLSESLGLPFKIPREDVLAASLIAGANFFLLALRTGKFYLLRLAASSMALALVVPLEVRAATVGVFLLLAAFALQRRWSTLLSLVGIPVVIFGVLAVANVPLAGRVGGSSAADLLGRQFSVVPLLLEGKVTSNDPQLPHDATSGTAVWRYNWWTALIADTTSSVDTALFGVGFGADITGPLQVDQSASDRPLRSPHNIVINLFARTGAVGLMLWLAVQGSWLYIVLRGIDASIRTGKAADADYLLWMCTYALTILVVAVFGVVLESPVGAIPFFLLTGMAVRKAEEFAVAAVPASLTIYAPNARVRPAVRGISGFRYRAPRAGRLV